MIMNKEEEKVVFKRDLAVFTALRVPIFINIRQMSLAVLLSLLSRTAKVQLNWLNRNSTQIIYNRQNDYISIIASTK